MTNLSQLEKAMRAQFVWEKNPTKPLQTLESQEGAKDIARMIFVGVADMNGFSSEEIQTYLDMGFDSFRTKLRRFRDLAKEARQRVKDGIIYRIDDDVKKFYLKTSLTLNAIKYSEGGKYLSINKISEE